MVCNYYHFYYILLIFCYRESWNQLGTMDKSTAMQKYSEVLGQLVPNWNQGMHITAACSPPIHLTSCTEAYSDAQKDTLKATHIPSSGDAPILSRPSGANRKSAGFGPVFSTLVHGDPENIPEHMKGIPLLLQPLLFPFLLLTWYTFTQ